MITKFAEQHNPKIKWIMLFITILGIIGSLAMICLGIAGLHFKNDDNTALWVIGLILLIVCVFFFIKTLRKIIRFHNAPKLDELMNGDKNRKIK